MTDPHRYRISVQKRETEDGEMFEGTSAEFPDVAVYESSFDAAYNGVIDVISGLQSLYEKQGRTCPPPQQRETEYSGKFVVRLPKSLHRDLAETATLEGVSLNQYVLGTLSCHENLRVEARNDVVPTVVEISQPAVTTLAVSSGGSVVSMNLQDPFADHIWGNVGATDDEPRIFLLSGEHLQ